MECLNGLLNQVSNWVWGPIMLTFLLGTGFYLTVGLKAFTWRNTVYAFISLWRG